MKTLSLSLLLTSFVSPLTVAQLPKEFPKDFVKIRYETEALSKYQLQQVQCLTEALWYEARGETKEGLKAVASVILNRSNSKQFKGSICDVVHQRKQLAIVTAILLVSLLKSSLSSIKSKPTPTYQP